MSFNVIDVMMCIMVLLFFQCQESAPAGPDGNGSWIVSENRLTDPDGNVYTTVRIGAQVWTVENLNTKKYIDGTPITHITDAVQWSSCTTGAYCYYQNKAVHASKYGALYNWYTANSGKLAPKGWKIPTVADWDTLQNFLIEDGCNWDGTTTGNKIAKALAAESDWISNTKEGTVGNNLSKNNSSGFSALPGGYRNLDGEFISQSRHGNWWSVSQNDELTLYGRGLDYNKEDLYRSADDKEDGLSVRLLQE